MTRSDLNRMGALLALALGFCTFVAESSQAQVRRERHAPQVDIWTDASVYRPGEPVRVTVTSDRPVFVAVFEVGPGGEVRRLTQPIRGVQVRPDRPLHIGGGRHSGDERPGETALFAVAQQEPFRGQNLTFLVRELEVRYRRSAGLHVTFMDAHVDRQGRQPLRVVARTSYQVDSRWAVCAVCGRQEDRHSCAHLNVPARARVYVDGIFAGIGLEALYTSTPGWHRVTLVTQAGRKYTEQVRIGGSSTWRPGPVTAEKPGDGRYQREKH